MVSAFQNLIVPIIALGGTLIIAWLTSFHYFNTRINNQIMEKMIIRFSSPDINDFLENITNGNIPMAMLRDFYTNLFDIWKPRRLFKKIWIIVPVSGALLILSGFLLGIHTDFVLINNISIVSIANYCFIFAIFLFIISVILIILLGNTLI